MLKKAALFFLTSLVCALFVQPLTTANAQEGGYTLPPPDLSIVLETNQGEIELELFSDVAPRACENMVGLAEKGY